MQAIIEGKRYDTEKAELIAEESSTHPVSDFKWWQEKLYRTKNGSWFMEAEGGPMTHYRKTVGDNSTYGHKLYAMSETEVFNWLQQHGKIEELEQYFGDQIEDA